MQRVEARFMRAALRLAARGLGRTSPNPAVLSLIHISEPTRPY